MQPTPSQVVDLWGRARSAHPAIEVKAPEFARALKAAALKGGDWENAAEDLYLAVAVARGDPKAVEAFEDILAQLDAPLRRLDPDDAFVSEVLQQLRIKLLVGEGTRAPRIIAYRGLGSLSKWVRAVALNTGLRIKSKGLKAEGEHAAMQLAATVDSAEVRLLRARHQKDFEAAFSRALQRLPARDRSVLRLRHVDGLGLEEIAAYLHVDRSTAVRALRAMKDRLTRQTREELTQSLRLRGKDIDSLVRAMGSSFRVSVGRLLGDVEKPRQR